MPTGVCAFSRQRRRRPPDVPHHLVGHLDPSGHWSAADFQQRADELVDEIRARGKRPLLVGGTALYVRAWLKGFGAPVPRDEALRRELRQLAADRGPEALHARLAALDPERAANLHPNDIRRVIRALEITQLTGRPASEQRGEWTGPNRQPAVVIRLAREAADLEDRIKRRTARMFDEGVIAEAEALLTSPLSAEARQVLGLAELEALLAEEISEDAAMDRIAQRTRQFARKQATFFRSFDDARVVEIASEESDQGIGERIARLLSEP